MKLVLPVSGNDTGSDNMDILKFTRIRNTLSQLIEQIFFNHQDANSDDDDEATTNMRQQPYGSVISGNAGVNKDVLNNLKETGLL